jgi:hypothetical protein
MLVLLVVDAEDQLSVVDLLVEALDQEQVVDLLEVLEVLFDDDRLVVWLDE